MKTPLIVGILWILTSYFVCGIGASTLLNCSDYKGNIIRDGETFQSIKDMCQTCRCDNGYPIMCHSVKCAPPTTPCNWIPLTDQCCKFECPETGLTGEGDISVNSTKPVDNGVDEASSDSITTLGLRLVASTVTSFLVLALLLFMLHRLRQRRLMMAMRRYQDNRLEQMDDFEERVIPEYWLQCPPYEDPPPPYTPPKPDPRLPPREAPPPYEEVPSNNNNINMTPITQNSQHQNGHVEQDSSGNVSHVNHVRQPSDRLHDALNTELIQSLRMRQQQMSRSSSEESVDLSLPNHTAHYIRKSNSTANAGGLCNGNRNVSGAGNSERSRRLSGVLNGTCRVGHSNSFAAPPSLPCGYDTVPWHKTGYGLPKSCSNTAVTRPRHGGQERPIRRSHSGLNNVKPCSHRGPLPRERGLREPDDMCRLEEMSLESYNNNNIAINITETADTDNQPSDRQVVAGTLEGYVPPSFQDQPDNRGIASSKRNKSSHHHQRYGSLPSNICTDTHTSASSSTGHVRSSSQDSSHNEAHVDPCPLLHSSEMTMPSSRFNRDQCDNGDRNELMTFRSPRRPQSLEHLRHPGHAYNIPDITTISESGMSGNDSSSQQQPTQQQQNLQDLQALRELRLSNLLRSPECGPVNIANSPPSPVQPLSIQGAAMPRSSSIVSDVSMFSVCSETGEKKLSQITGQALLSDAQYPENAFVGRPTLSVFSGADNCIATNRLRDTSENRAGGTVTGPSSLACVANSDNQNGNGLENKINTIDTCAGNEAGRDIIDRGYDVGNRKDDKQKPSRENRLSHVKLRHKNKHRTHRSSSGSTSSGKKRHSLTSDSPSESATCVRPLPRSRSEVKHAEQLSELRKQYRMKKGDPQSLYCDTMPPSVHSHHSFHGDPDTVTCSPGANNWGEVSGLYAVTSITGDVRQSKSKSKLNAANKSGNSINKPKSPTDGNSSLFCPTNVAFVKKKVKSSKRGRHGNTADQRSHDIKISGYSEPGSKIVNSDLDIELSPMHELSNNSTKFKDSCIVDNQDGVFSDSRSNMDNNNFSM